MATDMDEQQRYKLENLYALPQEVLEGLIEEYPLEQFIRGFMALGVLKSNSDYLHVWLALWDKYKQPGQSFDDWNRDIARPMIDQRPAFTLTGAVFYDYNRAGVVTFKTEVSEYDVWRMKYVADNRRRLTVNVYIEGDAPDGQ